MNNDECVSFTRTELRALVREVALEARRFPNDPDRIADAVTDGVFPILRIEVNLTDPMTRKTEQLRKEIENGIRRGLGLS